MIEMEADGIVVVVVTVLAGLDERGHHLSGDRGVLVLVAAGPDGHVEAVEIAAVINRHPVIGDVIKCDNATRVPGM